MKKYLPHIFLALAYLQLNAQVVSLSPINSPFCAGEQFVVYYTTADTFANDNSFIVQLSDALGNFGNPDTIGNVYNDISGRIQVTIPQSVMAGTGYRMRIISTDTLTTGPDNGSNLSILPAPPPPVLTISGNACQGLDSLIAHGTTGASQINWYYYPNYPFLSGTNISYIRTTVAGGNDTGALANQLNYPTGVVVDSLGYIYISDGHNNRIQRFPPGSNSSTNGVTVGGGAGAGAAHNQLNTPDNLYVDGHGNVFVADAGNNRIIEFPAGSVSGSNGIIVAGGNGAGSAHNQVGGPDGVFVDASGNIFVADWNNNRVLKFPPGSDSTTYGTIVAGGNGIGYYANQLTPATVFVDGGGYLYVADYQNQRILKFPPGSDSTTLGTTIAGGNFSGSNQNQFSGLNGIWIDSSGAVYASDLNRVLKFPVNSNSSTNGFTVAAGIMPGEVCVDRNGNIYVPDLTINGVVKFTAGGSLDTTFIPPLASQFWATYSGGACPSANSDTITVNSTFTYVQLYTSEYSSFCQGSVDTLVGMPTNAGNPSYKWFINNNLKASTSDSVFTTNLLNNGDTVMVIMTSNEGCSADSTSENIWVATVYPIPPAPDITSSGNMCPPYDTLAIHANDPNAVIWYRNNSQAEALYDAYTVAGGNRYGAAFNQLAGPFSVFMDNNNFLYVSDNANNRVLRYPPGSTSGTNGIVVAARQLNSPTGIWVDNNGNVFVADANNNRILKFPAGSDSTTIGVIVAGGNGPGNAANQLYYPKGICLDKTGNLYVADYINSRVQKFPQGSDSTTNGITVAANELFDPTGVAIDSIGRTYVSDLYGTVKRYNANSNRNTVPVIIGAGQMNSPTDVFIDKRGNVFVVDEYSSKVLKFPFNCTSSTVGTIVAGSSISGSGFNQLSYPTGLFADSVDNIYIADSYNNRVQEWIHSAPATAYIPLSTGNYTAAYISSYGCTSGQSDTITVGAAPIITIHGLDTLSTGTYLSYQWLLNGAPLANNTGQTVIAANTGNYTAVVTDTNGCIDTSAPFNVILAGIIAITGNCKLLLYPNPNKGNFIIQSNNNIGQNAVIYDIAGRIVNSFIISSDIQGIDLASLSSGTYLLEIMGSNHAFGRFTISP